MPKTTQYAARRTGKSKGTRKDKANGANLGFEEKLWQAANKMRGHMATREYALTTGRYIGGVDVEDRGIV